MSDTGRQWSRIIAGRGILCPICSRDHGCLMAVDRTAVFCLRVQQGCARRRDGSPITAKEGAMGWLHRLTGERAAGVPENLRVSRPGAGRPADEWARDVRNYSAVLKDRRLKRLADELGVTAKSLRRLGVGWDGESGCFTFPMFDGRRQPCGVRLRSLDGRFKGAVRGSRNGLFVPEDYEPVELPPGLVDDEYGALVLVVPEGPTDCAAALDLGFRAIGRPSTRGGIGQLVELLGAGPVQDVVVFADNDGVRWLKDKDGRRTEPFFPGIEGGLAVARALVPVAGRLRFALPPAAKDLRKWMAEGGGLAAINAIVSASDVTDGWLAAAQRRLDELRAAAKKEAPHANGDQAHVEQGPARGLPAGRAAAPG